MSYFNFSSTCDVHLFILKNLYVAYETSCIISALFSYLLIVIVVEAETVGNTVFNSDFGAVLGLLLHVNTAGSRSGGWGCAKGTGIGHSDRVSSPFAILIRILNDLQDYVLLSVLTLWS